MIIIITCIFYYYHYRCCYYHTQQLNNIYISVGESDYADWCLNLQQQVANLQQEFKEKEAMYIQKIKSLSEVS